MNITLRALEGSDINNYIELQKEVFLEGINFDEEVTIKNWDKMFAPGKAMFAIISEDNQDFCGYCGCNNIETETPEIEVELFEVKKELNLLQASGNLVHIPQKNGQSFRRLFHFE